MLFQQILDGEIISRYYAFDFKAFNFDKLLNKTV